MTLAQPPYVQPRAAVLGSPIAHSLSPVLHRAAYAATGLDWRYDAIECDEAGLPALLTRVRSEPGWRGLSLTMPLKIAAVPLVDAFDHEVDIVGALNTIIVSPQEGRPAHLMGHNTDVAGIVAAVMESGVQKVNGAVVLGAGGTARAAVAALAAFGLDGVIVAARDLSRTEGLVRMGKRLGIEVEGAPWSALPAELRVTDLVISTTPDGATDALAAPGIWPAGVPLVDVLYQPWPTELARYAALRGSVVVGGMAVLASQAAEQFALMSGLAPAREAMRAAGERALLARTCTQPPTVKYRLGR